MRRCEVTICQMLAMRKAFRREISTTACRENDTAPLSSPGPGPGPDRRYSKKPPPAGGSLSPPAAAAPPAGQVGYVTARE